MNNDRIDRESPIGVFDSGIGGLTVAREIMRQIPNEKIVYFGDTARVPYGNKSKETVTRFSRQIVRFLETHHVKTIEVGKHYNGVVKSMTSYGVFVDIGGVDGMVHISELSRVGTLIFGNSLLKCQSLSLPVMTNSLSPWKAL